MEVWKEVLGYKNYNVSNLGDILSLSREVPSRYGLTRITKERVLLPNVSHGYCIVQLGKKRMRVHRLVAIAFIPNPNNKPYINHKDGNKLNNNVSNLEWSTAKENVHHAFHTGLTDYMNGAILTETEVREIKKLLDLKIKQSEIALQYDVSRGTITDINIRKTWKNV